MNNSRTELVARHSILKLLSDAEVASLSSAEAAAPLSDGDEYLDLDQLDRGVCLATGMFAPRGQVLPRKALRAHKWHEVLTQLEAYRNATAHFGVGRGTLPPSPVG
jgi:hypothetical protein